MSLRPYQQLKPSDIEYLDAIPNDWPLKRLGDLVAFAQGKAHEPYIDDDGDYICVNSRFVSTSGKTIKTCSVNLTPASLNDILMVMSDLPNGRALARAYYVEDHGKYAVNQRVCRISAEKALPRFLFYLLDRHPGLMQNDDGVHQTHLSNADFQKLKLYLPSVSEQNQIARFLDHETARIDALIEQQQRLIELLKEKRQAVISHAVTKGLDPTVPMKDSGVEWLGEVPAHWQVGALGYFAGIDTGATPDRGNPEYWDGDIPWIKTGEVNYENISQAEEHITWEGVKNSAAKVAPKGTLLMAMYGQGVTRGRVAILEIEAAYNQACAGIFVDDRVRVEYLRLFFIAAYPYIRDGGNETSQMNLSSGHIAKIKITVPPINEQISAEHFLNAEMVRFDSLIIEAGLLAQHLQERRSALISAAVTGKIDVRGWQPPASAPSPELKLEAV
jgi:type I restriction enzyme S subunit